MKRIKILSLLTGIGLLFSSVPGHTFLAYDAMRTAEFAVQGVQRMLSLITEYQKVYSKQEELKVWENRATMKEEDLLSGEMYQYLENANTADLDSEKYYPPQENAEAAEKYIKENFFLPADTKEFTQEKKKEIEQRRYVYVEALAKEVLSLSAGVRKSAAQDLQRLKDAKTNAGGNIQQVDLLVQTKKSMAEQKAADVLLQAKLLELEVAKMLLHMDLQYQENPEATVQK